LAARGTRAAEAKLPVLALNGWLGNDQVYSNEPSTAPEASGN